jgi:putative transposase
MGRPYSLDLRERVVAAVHGGISCRDAAAHFAVSHSSAIRWVRRAREEGSPAALPMGGKRPFSLAAEQDWVLARLTQKPDITLRELLAELLDRGVQVSYFGVWNFIRRSRLSFKKSLHASEQGSCPNSWCRSSFPEWGWLNGQAANAGIPTKGASLKGAIVSSVI